MLLPPPAIRDGAAWCLASPSPLRGRTAAIADPRFLAGQGQDSSRCGRPCLTRFRGASTFIGGARPLWERRRCPCRRLIPDSAIRPMIPGHGESPALSVWRPLIFGPPPASSRRTGCPRIPTPSSRARTIGSLPPILGGKRRSPASFSTLTVPPGNLGRGVRREGSAPAKAMERESGGPP
jgi:hypothetical protein